MSTVKIFSGSGSIELAKKIASEFGKPLGKGKLGKFSDGELSYRYTETVRGSDVYIIQSTVDSSDNIMELFLMIDAAKRASAKFVNVVIPYYGYARQDRKDKPRIAVSAKLLANLLTASGASRIVSCDLHAGQIQGFFDIHLDHLNGSSVFVPYVKKLNLNILVQEFISEADGEDVRAIVVGDKVVASMKRKAKPGDFRANIHLGGSSYKYELTEEEENTAITAVKVLGLSVAGVDMIQSERGTLVIEVNSSPGLEGIETTSEIDVASEIIKYMEDSLSKESKSRKLDI